MTRTVLITGGNRGIGRSTALAFAKKGYRVAVTYRSEPPDFSDSTNPPASILAVRCDVTSGDDVEEAFARVESELGNVEILVSNAGITADQLLLSMRDEAWTSVVDTNLTAAYRVARRATSKMIRARWGRMIFVSSVVAMLGSPGQTNYAASKAGLIGFSRSLAREIGGRGVTVNVVAPGFVKTDMTVDLSDSRRSELLGAIPLARMAEPSEVAGAIVYVASEEAGYVTGAVIPVDGGLGMGH
jgi:3-oxoacyl-[acyl-carrier protein] reductase